MSVDIEFLKSIGVDDESVATKLLEKVEADVQGLKSKNSELLGKYNDKKAELSSYEGVDPEAHWAYKKKLDALDDQNLMDKGEFDQILKKKEEEWVGRNRDLEEKYSDLNNRYVRESENRAILGAVGDQGDGELIMDVIRQRGLVATVDSDNGSMLKVKGIDGQALENIDALLEQMKKSDKYSRLFNSTQKGGGGAKGSTGVSAGSGTENMTGRQKMAAGRK
jgi:hypothetical protein